MISVRNITVAQAIVFVACMIVPLLAYKFVNVDAAGASAMSGMILSFLMGRTEPPPPPDPPPPPPPPAGAGKVIGFAAMLAAVLWACVDTGLPTKDAVTILSCQDLGRACKADGGASCYDVYDACMKDGGLR